MATVKTDLNATPSARLPFTPTSTVPASNVQAAIDRVANDLVALDVPGLANDVAELQDDVASIEDDVSNLQSDVAALTNAVVLKGIWDASTGSFPGSGAAKAGWSYIVSVGGTVDGIAFTVTDRIVAIADNASTSTYAANWHKLDYTDQVLSVAGKTGDVTIQAADITDASADGRSLITAADYAAMRGLLSLGDLATGDDAEDVPFTQSGTGAVAYSVQQALRDRVPSVTDYGIGANGFEGAAALAIAAIGAESPEGNTLFVPAGDWIVEETIDVDVGGVILAGAGRGTRIINAIANAPAIHLGGAGQWRLGVRDMVFGQHASVAATTGNSGLLVSSCNDVSLDNVECYAFPSALHLGVYFAGVYQLSIDQLNISGTLSHGGLFEDVASCAFQEASVLACGGSGLAFAGVEGMWGSNVHVYGNAVYGFLFGTHASRPNKNNFLTNWVGDTSGDHNWFITDLQSSQLVNCWSATQLLTTENVGANGFLLASDKVRNIQFNGGRSGNNNGNGVYLFDTGSSAPRDIDFDGFDFGSDLADLPSNGQGGVSGYGLIADAGCTGIRIRGGQNKGNPTAPFSSTGIELIDQVAGYVNKASGLVSGSTDGSGDITFNPGMDETPVAVQCIFNGTYALTAQPTSLGASSVTVRVFHPNGDPVTSSAIEFRYRAYGSRCG